MVGGWVVLEASPCEGFWAKMGAILSRTGRMKPKEKDGGSSGGSRRSSGHHVNQHQGGGRDHQGKGGQGEMGGTHTKKAKTTASPHSTPNRKKDRLDKGGKARPPNIVIQDAKHAIQDYTTNANERLHMIQDGIQSHKGQMVESVSVTTTYLFPHRHLFIHHRSATMNIWREECRGLGTQTVAHC